jgi:RNA polymerase primary sigma factor
VARLSVRGRPDVDSPQDSYFYEIRRIPLLNAQEERDLARRIAEGDRDAHERMVRANLRLVVSIARRYAGRGLCLQDLIEEGNLGLLQAVRRFDPARGVRFSTYATFWIKQAIRMALINTSRTIRVPAHVITLLAAWDRTTAELQEELGRTPRAEEVVRRLGWTGGELDLVQKALRVRNAGVLTDAQPDRESALDELLVDHRAEAPDRNLLAADTTSRVRDLLDQLEEREATVLRLRFGLTDEEPKTLRVIGERLGLTHERVRQIETRALSKLSARLRAG